MNTKRQYKNYTSEFKAEALALFSEQGYTVQEAHLHWALRLAYFTAGNKNLKSMQIQP